MSVHLLRRYATVVKKTAERQPYLFGTIHVDAVTPDPALTVKKLDRSSEKPVLRESWYGRLTADRTSEEVDKKLQELGDQVESDFRTDSKLHPSFRQALNRSATEYARTKLGSTTDNMILTQPARRRSNYAMRVQDQTNTLVERVVRSLADGRENRQIIMQRMKIKRQPPPFYLHQQLEKAKHKRDLMLMIELYFSMPEPRAFHLTVADLEKLLQMYVAAKTYKGQLLEPLVKFFDDLIDSKVPLTVFEQTKYVYFYTKYLLNLKRLSEEEALRQLLKKQKQFAFSRASWKFLLETFPKSRDKILRQMSSKVTLNRDLVELLIDDCNSPDRLVNIVEYARLRQIHLDAELFEAVIRKLLEFHKYPLARRMLDSMLLARRSGNHQRPWHSGLLTERHWRLLHNEYDAFNQILFNRRDPATRFVHYRFFPSPTLFASFIDGLTGAPLSSNRRAEITDLLGLMVDRKLPLPNSVSKHILQGLVDSDPQFESDIQILAQVSGLVYGSIEYNKKLHHCLRSPWFRNKESERWVEAQEVSATAETLELFNLAFAILARHKDAPETPEKVKAHDKILQIYRELELVKNE